MKPQNLPLQRVRGYLTALALVLAALLLETCATNPVTGERQLALISESQEIAMGQQADPSIVAEFGLYEDAELQRFIEQKGKAMAAVSHRPDLPWEFKIVDSPVVNAFAVPGGYVYFTRGIMAHFNNEAQFAGVLGHEIGHVTARHTVQQQSRALLAQLGLVAGMIAVPELAQLGDVAGQGLQLLLLKFGRDAERQSDELGVEYSTKIGYDATHMADFFNTLDRLSGGSENRLPTFLSTHPDPANREARVAELAQQQKAQTPQADYEVGRNSYLRMIDGMIYGEDPRQGYVENNVFYHPELRFQYPVPQGWAVNNTPQQVQMAPQNGKALMVLRLAQGNNLEAAAQNTLQQNQLQLVENRQTQINGLPALLMVADLVQEGQDAQGRAAQQVIRTLSAFIQYGGNIYHLMGMSLLNDYNSYLREFDYTMSNFRQLTDQSKINRQPERIDIVTVDRTTTLQNALQAAGIPADRFQELAVLNGMELNERLEQGTMIKVVRRG